MSYRKKLLYLVCTVSLLEVEADDLVIILGTVLSVTASEPELLR